MFDKNTRFLVVDDLKTIRSLMKDILKKLGFSQINEAEDGQKALNMLKEAADTDNPFGFIISDWNMPNKTGLSLLEDCLKDDSLKSIPFLMVTIESEREYVLRAIQMGVSDFVVKPFTAKTIEQKIRGIWIRLQSGEAPTS
ncbi:MAG: response regulator [Bdellovibrionaceae bacterium]|nr:response regulator [Bdellovibrionales bacterium]MCB9086084.1 response regulator [Pseudobdellovibrionaceae bacterium]